jgi:hypothetical protein
MLGISASEGMSASMPQFEDLSSNTTTKVEFNEN